MEKNINTTSKRIYMTKTRFLLAILFLFVSLGFVNAVTQEQLIFYNYEEGTGTIALDSSGNNHIGVFVGTPQYTTTKKFGVYGIDVQGSNDYIVSSVPSAMPSEFSVSVWADADGLSDTTLWILYSSNTSQMIEFRLDIDGNKAIDYNSTSGIEQTTVVSNNVLNINQYYMYTFTFNITANTFKYYQDGTLITNGTITNAKLTDTQYFLRIGADEVEGRDFDGQVDNFRLIQGIINQSQITEMFNTGVYTAPTITSNETNGSSSEESSIVGAVRTNLIQMYSPNGTGIINTTNPFTIASQLTQEASCDLYIDNNKVYTNSDVIAFSDTINDIPKGIHEYFLYCYLLLENGTLYYDVTNITTLNVSSPLPSQIVFVFSPTDSTIDLEDFKLFVVTPCPNKGIVIPFTGRNKYSMLNNPSIYFAPIVDDVAYFNVTEGENTFCLVNGIGQYNIVNGYSDVWYMNRVNGMTNIGTYSTPSNVTQIFFVQLERGDLYEPYDPHWWGTSWTSIISSLIGVVLGLALVGIGVTARMPQLSVMGVALIILALGFQFGNLLFGVLL